jgi:GAF domain-containing protein
MTCPQLSGGTFLRASNQTEATMKAPFPKSEAKRIEILWQYDVLDTPPEKSFDELTSLAAYICEAPVALITLVDEDRQWFKSKVGISLKETSRDISMCAHAILQKNLLIVPDATQDKRFKDNPFVVSEPKIRFYAGAPLISPAGQALGTLCVIDKVPRELTGDQKEALRILARHVMAQLELRRQTRELGRSRDDCEQLRKDLARARAEIKKLQTKTSRAIRRPANR